MNSDHFITDEEWDRADWEGAYDWAFEKVRHIALKLKARICPICNKDCGKADYEPDDPSVGIFGSFWFNVCEEHGEFATLGPDGEQEQWKEPDV
jgi:hypothetical protein